MLSGLSAAVIPRRAQHAGAVRRRQRLGGNAQPRRAIRSMTLDRVVGQHEVCALHERRPQLAVMLLADGTPELWSLFSEYNSSAVRCRSLGRLLA